jgi:hypothetical protein
MRQYIRYSYTSRQPRMHFGRKVLYNMFTESRMHMKLARLIKMWLHENDKKVRICNICLIAVI